MTIMWMVKNNYYSYFCYSKIISTICSLFIVIYEKYYESLLLTHSLIYLRISLPYIPIVFGTQSAPISWISWYFYIPSNDQWFPGSLQLSRLLRKEFQGSPYWQEFSNHSTLQVPQRHPHPVKWYSIRWLMLCFQERFMIDDKWISIVTIYCIHPRDAQRSHEEVQLVAFPTWARRSVMSSCLNRAKRIITNID